MIKNGNRHKRKNSRLFHIVVIFDFLSATRHTARVSLVEKGFVGNSRLGIKDIL